MNLTLERAKELNKDMVTEEHLVLHSLNVCYAMGAMAEHFGADREHWMAVGYLHDFDYEKYPEEHLRHTEEPLLEAGVSPEDVRAILSHGYSIVNDVRPETNLEKSLFTVDELTGIIQACARMRPNGITDLQVKSFMKKFKDKKFAAKCSRETIRKGCEMLGMEVRDVAAICIEGMRPHAEEIGLLGTEASEPEQAMSEPEPPVSEPEQAMSEPEPPVSEPEPSVNKPEPPVSEADTLRWIASRLKEDDPDMEKYAERIESAYGLKSGDE